MGSAKLSYRAEIDGLRAIAVVSVIFYHAQMVLFGRDWFLGGYLGVDIFFVISGYLITRLILAELYTKDSFSFLNFYERRARRILPMLFLIIFVSIPLAWQKFLPSDFVEYAQSVLASLGFGANFFFYFTTTEYGADSALLKPFLHMWSLGVEEQFYLIFPVIAVVCFKYFKRYFLAIIIGLLLISLQFSEFMGERNPELNFYLPFSRFWELAVGSLLAYRELNYKAVREGVWRQICPILGLIMIMGSILLFNEKTPHPGYYTIVPILGVALIIVYASQQDGWVGKFLGSKPFVWIGLISYSAYLWHFLIFAFARSEGTTLTNLDKFGWIALTFGLSIFSYFWVEKPFRNKTLISSRRLWASLIISAFIVIGFMGYVLHSQGIWARYSSVQQQMIQQFNKAEYEMLNHPLGEKGMLLRANKMSSHCGLRDPKDACRFGQEKIVFLGDSFVGQYERAILDKTSDLNLGFISFNYEQCPFVSPSLWFGNTAECSLINEERRRIIETFTDEKIFVVSAAWFQFFAAKKRTDNPLEDGRKKIITGNPVTPEFAQASYFENIEWLVEQGHKVILIRSSPFNKVDGKNWLGENLDDIDRMKFPQSYNVHSPSAIRQADNRVYPKFDPEHVLVINPADALCVEAENRCLDVKENYGPLYNGGPHLSYFGATLVAEKIRQEMDQLGWE